MSDKRPQTIQFFLPQGKPRGICITVITTRIVQAVLVHRNKLADADARPELRNVGVYFLFGQPEDAAMPTVYIGEAEDCSTWFKQHNVNKDFGQHAEGRGQMVEDGFTVLPGSRGRKELVPSAGDSANNTAKLSHREIPRNCELYTTLDEVKRQPTHRRAALPHSAHRKGGHWHLRHDWSLQSRQTTRARIPAGERAVHPDLVVSCGELAWCPRWRTGTD